MSNAITTADQVTPELITALLRRKGMLPDGEVQAVMHHVNPAFNSTVTHLELDYSATAPHGAPQHLLLKRNLAERGQFGPVLAKWHFTD